MLGLFKKKTPTPPLRFPPMPDWQPDIVQPVDRIIERLRFYTHGQRDIAALAHGTCVLLPQDMPDAEVQAFAEDILARIIHQHPDMSPSELNDGNLLVQYNQPAVSLVLDDVATQHAQMIEANHQRALTPNEVLITPLGQNIFDEVGKRALFGRCFMFMDARQPRVIRIVRKD